MTLLFVKVSLTFLHLFCNVGNLFIFELSHFYFFIFSSWPVHRATSFSPEFPLAFIWLLTLLFVQAFYDCISFKSWSISVCLYGVTEFLLIYCVFNELKNLKMFHSFLPVLCLLPVIFVCYFQYGHLFWNDRAIN